jgi:hypothetical protein
MRIWAVICMQDILACSKSRRACVEVPQVVLDVEAIISCVTDEQGSQDREFCLGMLPDE